MRQAFLKVRLVRDYMLGHELTPSVDKQSADANQESHVSSSNEPLETTGQLQVIPTMKEIVEEMIYRAEASQASQTSMVPENNDEVNEVEIVQEVAGNPELEAMLLSSKFTAKKPVIAR